MGRKPVGWLLALSLLLVGCASPSRGPVVPEAPPVDGGSAAPGGGAAAGASAAGAGADRAASAASGEGRQPRAVPRLIGRIVYRPTAALPDVVDGVTAVTLEEWESEVAVGSGDVLITWQLDTHDAGPYSALLRTSGAEPAEVRAVLGVIQARFAAPLPDRFEAWLQGVGGSHTKLLRAPEPTVYITYRAADGALQSLEGAEAVLPDGPLWLQLSFDRPVEQGSLAAWLADVEARVGDPLIVRQESASRWVVEMDQVPARMTLDLRRVVASGSGLPVAHSPVTLRSEASLPYLERVDLATGAGERLLTLPPEITEAWPSPDGAYIALRGWQAVGNEMWEQRGAVVDLAANRLLEAPLPAGTLQWAGGRLFNHPPWWVADRGWEAWAPGAPDTAALPFVPDEPVPGTAVFSPDGRTAAYLGPEAEGDPYGDDPLWMPLVLLDVATGERQVVEGFARNWFRGKGDVRRWVAWSPDGRRIAALDPLARAGRSALVVYDLELGERQVASEPVPLLAWGARLAWSPGGASVLAFAEGYNPWVIPLDGSPAVPLPGALFGRAFWDGTGGRILGARGPWEGVFVYSLADGTWTELGDGLPAGWDGNAVYVIRWPGASSRYVPPRP
ncbi:hypothetical protein [Symbiobacterium terraclitae]|uniref:hypothetical protein n=1 Tax=Symbiobacterium terraclitae TaxID=557451 RepID=UPI0035B54D23